MVMFKLGLLRTAICEVATQFSSGDIDVKNGCASVDDMFHMLQTVVREAVGLLECGYDASTLKDQCAMLRSKIDGFVDALNCRTAKCHMLPKRTTLQQLNQLSCGAEIISPKVAKDSDRGESKNVRRHRAWINLEGCCFLDGASCSLDGLLQWQKSNGTSAQHGHILTLRVIEAYLFKKSGVLNVKVNKKHGTIHLERMQSLVDAYQDVARQWRQLSRLTSILRVEQRSREMLVLWIAFCLVHQTCVREVPLVAEYNIALDWNDLKVAVLSDRAAITALQYVVKYVRLWNKRAGGPPLFHLSNQGPTFDFARRFGQSSAHMLAIYNQAVEVWGKHEESKWKEIEQKKRKASELRAEISRLNQNLRSKQYLLAVEEERLRALYPNTYDWSYRKSSVKSQLGFDIQRITSDIRSTEATLSSTIAVPPYLVRPLPPANDASIQVIFMLNMPRNIEILGNLCLTAQRALAPATATSAMVTMPNVSPTAWLHFYNQYAPSRVFCGTPKAFKVSPSPFTLPRIYGPSTVDDLCSLSEYKRVCVWNPTILGTAMTWKDASGTNVNPFSVSPTCVIESFIEKLPEPAKQLQWMNAWPGGETRGNLVYAQLCQQPESFEKVSFIALGSLRAFSNQQYRKLQWALVEDLLPWTHPAVKTIVRQSLYQIGIITDEDNPQPLWKTDMLESDGLETFCAALDGISNRLKQTPRSFECIPLLSELTGYLHQFSPDAQSIVQTFAKMTRNWAENTQEEYSNESSPRRVAEIRQKECLLYGYALLSHTLGPWDNGAAQEVCELVVLFRNSLICASIDLPSTESMIRLESKIAEMMSRYIAVLIGYVEKRGASTVLTVLIQLVSKTAPAHLNWRRFCDLPLEGKQFGSCFEALDESSDMHYAINLFSGCVLTNGNAPGGLPADIRQHNLFMTLFGRCNFEVTNSNGVFRTKRQYCDRLYDFALKTDGNLFVQELTLNSSNEVSSTMQLCSLCWLEEFAKSFPARLKELYSHWYWLEQNCVLFRPKVANRREVLFIAKIDDRDVLRCYKVPFSDTKRSYGNILVKVQSYDQFIQLKKPLLHVFHVLAKFEDKKFLHPLRSPKGVMKIELPRFKLTFCLNRNMQFESMEFKGYKLATRQQFDNFLPRFSRYLVLELQNRSDTSRSDLRVLVPVGSVIESSEGKVDISISGQPDCRVAVACYEQHRRLKVFETETISARLQLAVVYACAGTNVPSKRMRMTGAEAAIQILQACRSSRPYSELERGFLVTMCKLSYREPAVKILAVALLAESDRLAFLFGQSGATNVAMSSSDEKTEYEDMCIQKYQRNPLRSQFRSQQERMIVGHVKHSHELISTQETVSLGLLPVDDNYVANVEKKLGLFLKGNASLTEETPPMPLASKCPNAMSKAMLNELELSWKSYHAQAEMALTDRPDVLLKSFQTMLNEVSCHRKTMEKYLWDTFERATSSDRDRLLAHANFFHVLTVSDVVRCAIDNETLHTLAPKLRATGRTRFKKAILLFMETCVLEDKMERVIWKAERCAELSDSQLIDDLVNRRQWQLDEFPYWLAFEVEGRLQIRHEQYVIARHLIKSPGTVCQLNMGRGKTRVILPMLFLHFTRPRCQQVVRGHFLGSLLSEAQQFMHRYLAASSAQLAIFEQPFHRQISIGDRELELIHDALEEIKLVGGIQVVAPEHRMSLELKRLELGSDDPKIKIVDDILANDQYIDILDECDALLHHKYHLVYAVGVPEGLCGGVERWKAAEALLRIVANKTRNSHVAEVLLAPHVSCSSPDYVKRLGAYGGIRLSTVVESTRPLRIQLKEALVLDLIDRPPFELIWMNTFGGGNARDALIMTITDSNVNLQEALGDHVSKFTPYFGQLLALRGLVAFGVLEHCMEKRYRVDFGPPFPGTRPKKIAIPYRAADVPSERSEFSHPDVCIVLTLLGYYHSGLNNNEVCNVFRMLLRLDISEQQQEYGNWYTSVESGLSEEDREALCDVRHVSLADARQFEMLCRVYKYCMEAINFYLNTCVFPQDTQQYPQRLSRTAWNLAAGENNIGFSGTNDNHRLLPLSVTQREPDEPSLLGTNGKMIDKILQVTQSYEVLRPSLRTQIPWQIVLLYAIDNKAMALIDTGALLAGVANHDAAEFLLQLPDFELDGVTYYDSRKDYNCWMIAEKARRVVMPLKGATMHEKDTFVIFDEARSRGSDMKLLPNAAAMLTLGPKLTKDKLMQGAGRMRQLGCDQTLLITSFDEVAQGILQTSEKSDFSQLSAIDVLNWVMDNTSTESVRGLLVWASNGIHFRMTQLDRDAELVDENWSLETLYQEKLYADKIARVIESKMFVHFEGTNDELASAICQRGLVYGLDDEVCITSHTDECERELQVEEEAEEQREVELVQRVPAKEKTWSYATILRTQSVSDLNGTIHVLKIESYIRSRISPTELAGLSWPTANIFGTENFFSTIVEQSRLDGMNEFLRVIDAMLVFDNGEILLVSECEADHILELLWSIRDDLSVRVSFHFVNLAFACEGVDRFGVRATFQNVRMEIGSERDRSLPVLSSAACHLYNGETTFAKNQRSVVEPKFRELLGPLVQRESTLSNFVTSRGNSHKWTRSFLHELSCRMDLENCMSS